MAHCSHGYLWRMVLRTPVFQHGASLVIIIIILAFLLVENSRVSCNYNQLLYMYSYDRHTLHIYVFSLPIIITFWWKYDIQPEEICLNVTNGLIDHSCIDSYLPVFPVRLISNVFDKNHGYNYRISITLTKFFKWPTSVAPALHGDFILASNIWCQIILHYNIL